jgi:ribosomal protein L37AE/L43A
MTDIFENALVCENCDRKTERLHRVKDGFQLRIWKCHECHQEWIHPADQQDYDNFKRLKGKTFAVKLRLVGNSYTVSIPREIIDFEEEMQREMKEMNTIIRMSLEEPEKLSLYFSERLQKFIKGEP